MANPMKSAVEIQLGNKSYKARLTVDSIIQIENDVGCGIIKLATKMSEADIRMIDIISVLTPALRGGGKNIQADDVKKIVGDVGIVASATAVAELLTQSLVAEDKDEVAASGKKKG